MVVFIRSSDFKLDPRFSKYIQELSKRKIKYIIIGWDRSGQGITYDNSYFFKKKAKYGAKYKNLINKILWMIYVVKILLSIRDEVEIIHAADFDSALPALLSSKIYKRKLIFDIFDWIGNKSMNDSIIIKIIERLENIIAKNADAIILCEKERINQISEKNIKNILVMPNIPDIEINQNSNNLKYNENYKKGKYEYVIAYVGVFDFNRGIENLIELVTINKNILLLIAGYGGLENLVIESSNDNENIIYFGKVNYNEAIEIIRAADLLYACYYTINVVHKYAAPNKFYESLMCSTPIITTKDTLVGNKVNYYNTGFVIGESFKDLQDLMDTNNLLSIIHEKEINCRMVWENHYKDFISKFMNNEYIPLLEGFKIENNKC